MADYWVSQSRKYCEFCKCWIADNRPSVDFHEKGRRHQANVKKRLTNIYKHTNQTQKDNNKTDATLRQMESAALEAYQKDIEKNADLTSVAINKKLQESKLALSGSSSGGSVKKLWNEAKTRDGLSYYYNIMTNERVWHPPKEGFMTIQEQREEKDLETREQLKILEKFKRKEALLTMQEVKQQEMEAAARLAREKLKERKVVDELPPETCGPLLEPGKTDPYGRWQVVKESEVTIDLQLPQQPEYYVPVVEYEPEPIVKEFKEKTVGKIEDEEDEKPAETSFKKRKVGVGAKRNVRQRIDDD